MQARDYQLGRHQEQDRRGHAEEFLQVDAHAALDEHDAEGNGSDHSQQGSEEAHQFGRVERDGGKDQDGFDALAQHHQENEDEQAEPGVVSRQQADFSLDFSLELAARLHHEDDHGDDEEGGDEHDPAFEDVLVQVGAGDHHGHGNAAEESRAQRSVNGLAQFSAPNLGQIGQRDAD